MEMIKLAIFASGTGSNAMNIIRYFKNNQRISVECVISNKADAKIVNLSREANIPSYVFNNDEVNDGDLLLEFCQSKNITHIILAGYLRKIPVALINAYPNKMINIHPSLLPKFGGKGMYGMHVHKAVKDAGETQTGITIHFVNEHFDEGNYIAQFYCQLEKTDDPNSIQDKVQQLEQLYFPVVIDKVISEQITR